jgi:hypothetical protein
MLKLKKNERFVIAEDTVTCVEDFFNSLDRQDKSRISESWQVELDNAMRYYVVLLSLFVQPLENRHAAKKMRQQQQQSTDSLGRERERDWSLDVTRFLKLMCFELVAIKAMKYAALWIALCTYRKIPTWGSLCGRYNLLLISSLWYVTDLSMVL